MEEKNISVKPMNENLWCVSFVDSNRESDDEEIFAQMRTKEDAIRYARVCEQRTGTKVLLPI